MPVKPPKPVVWMGSSLKDLRALPEPVQDVFGFALYLAQTGDKHAAAKPLKGFAGAGVLEVVEDFDGDTFRAVYTVRFAGAIYVLRLSEEGQGGNQDAEDGHRSHRAAAEACRSFTQGRELKWAEP